MSAEAGALVAAFITADTWDESRRIVEAHPELLNDEADALPGEMLASEQVRRTLEDCAAAGRWGWRSPSPNR